MREWSEVTIASLNRFFFSLYVLWMCFIVSERKWEHTRCSQENLMSEIFAWFFLPIWIINISLISPCVSCRFVISTSSYITNFPHFPRAFLPRWMHLHSSQPRCACKRNFYASSLCYACVCDKMMEIRAVVMWMSCVRSREIKRVKKNFYFEWLKKWENGGFYEKVLTIFLEFNLKFLWSVKIWILS